MMLVVMQDFSRSIIPFAQHPREWVGAFESEPFKLDHHTHMQEGSPASYRYPVGHQVPREKRLSRPINDPVFIILKYSLNMTVKVVVDRSAPASPCMPETVVDTRGGFPLGPIRTISSE